MLRCLMIKRSAEFLDFPLDFIRCGRHDYLILMEIPTAATFAGEKEENAPREKKRCDHKERKDHKNDGGRVFQPASDHLRKFELVC